jgi:16S rRNA (uracil1498-N3)-methyltransferase
MRIPRFFIDLPLQVGSEIDLPKNVHRHAIQVLRLNEKDALILFNGEGGEYLATVVIAKKRASRVMIVSFDDVKNVSPLNTTVAVAMIKSDKMDLAIQKAVELGCNTIYPLYTKRSLRCLTLDRLVKKLVHWKGVIYAACEQCGRTTIPELYNPMELAAWVALPSDSLRLAMLPQASSKISAFTPPAHNDVTLIVGPEGGFTDEEVELLLSSGIQGIQCGQRILRAETAVVVGMALCQQQWGDL